MIEAPPLLPLPIGQLTIPLQRVGGVNPMSPSSNTLSTPCQGRRAATGGQKAARISSMRGLSSVRVMAMTSNRTLAADGWRKR